MGQASFELSGQRSSIDDPYSPFYEMIEMAPVACCLVGFDGRITFANRAFSDMLVYSLNQCRGLPIRDIILDGSRPAAEPSAVLDLQLDNFRGERQFRCKSGELRWVLVSAALLASAPPNRPAQLMLQAVSIEAQKAAEAVL